MPNANMRYIALAGLALALALAPGVALAQSTIAGQVTDETGGVLPGVTVEAASEALIEGSRTAFTDGQGRYSIIDLRPGVYAITFTLQGFSTFQRDEIDVGTGVTVPIDAQMAVGSLEETITVSGATPVVDVQQATQRAVIDRETIDALPTNRTTHTVGMILPGMKMTGSMVGGAGNTVVQQYITARGKGQEQNTAMVDGMDTRMIRGGGNLPYDNFGMAEEISIETNPTTAETSGGGIRINMIPRDGGNEFSGDVYFSGMNGPWQADNITDDLRALGATTPTATENMYDFNPSLGGPIVRDRLWFFVSGRLNRGNLHPAGATFFQPDANGILRPGDPTNPDQKGVNNTATDNISFRITWQASQNNKITTYRDQFWRYQSHFLGSALTDWATSPEEYRRGKQFVWPTKWTSTLTNRLLLEAGFQYWGYDNTLFFPQAGVLQDRPAGHLLGAIRAGEITPGMQTGPWYANASERDFAYGTVINGFFLGHCCRRYIQPSRVYSAAVSYVTGSHSLKVGIMGRNGYERIIRQEHNASLSEWYRGGDPWRVYIAPDPSDIKMDVNSDVGFYVQDQWTLDRLTVNAGVRVEHFRGGIGTSSAGEGRFVGARSVQPFEVWNFTDVLPRFSVVYDLSGDARTALKFSAGRYVGTLGAVPLERYNPMTTANEVRSWVDRDLGGADLSTNGDRIAQDNEIPASPNPNFGTRATITASDDLNREDSWDYSVGLQQELLPGVSLTAAWYHTREGNLWATKDIGITPDDFTPFTVVSPHDNSELTAFDLNAGVPTGQVFAVSSDINQRTYNGVELSTQARLGSGGTIIGGWYMDKQLAVDCDTNDPNDFRFCDETGELHQDLGTVPGIPFRHEFKFAIAHSLPGGFEAALSFISYPGGGRNARGAPDGSDPRWRDIGYAIPNTFYPGGRPAARPSRDIQLIAPGTSYHGRWNQLDISLKRRFRAGGVDFLPSLDLYNLNNSSAVLVEDENWGNSLYRPLVLLGGRLMRLGVLIRF